MNPLLRHLRLLTMIVVGGLLITPAAIAQSNGTGLPVPRYVSLKSDNVNMRIGPGRQFKVVWRYLKQGLPVEIIQEYENWRKVRDPEGAEGWILHSLLSGRRTVIINPGELGNSSATVSLHETADTASKVIANAEPGVVANVVSCQTDWCAIEAGGSNGFIEKNAVWGVYPDELIEE